MASRTEAQRRIRAAAAAADLSLVELGNAVAAHDPKLTGVKGRDMERVGSTLSVTEDKLKAIAYVTGAPLEFLRNGWDGVTEVIHAGTAAALRGEIEEFKQTVLDAIQRQGQGGEQGG